MSEPIEAYPLTWPHGRARVQRYNRERAKFDVTFARARDNIIGEAQRLVGRWTKPDLIISTNIALRRDGMPLANQRQPDDVGVAVFFTYKKKAMSFACDRWDRIEHNMQAIAKTIEALRGIDRWGTGDMLEAAFTGFAALPAPASSSWWEVLGVDRFAATPAVDVAYRTKRSESHPDRGGSTDRFAAVQRAWEQFKAERGIA